MAVVIAPAALLRRTRPASAGQIWIGVALLIPWLTVNFVRQHAVLGVLPLAGSWHDIGQLMHELHQTSTDQGGTDPHDGRGAARRVRACSDW